MDWWNQLSTRVKAMLSVVAAIGAALAAMQGPLEPLTPVWRGWARTYVSDIVQETVAPLSAQLTVVNESQLENRLSVIGLNLSQLRGEQTDLTLRLRDQPGDVLISRRLAEVTANISQLELDRNQTQCALDLLRGVRKTC